MCLFIHTILSATKKYLSFRYFAKCTTNTFIKPKTTKHILLLALLFFSSKLLGY